MLNPEDNQINMKGKSFKADRIVHLDKIEVAELVVCY